MSQVRCFGCGGTFSAAEGPTHRYMLSTPGCWAAYGAVLAREYESPALFGAVHQLSVGAYALQHPGDPANRRAKQSVWLHYAAIRLIFDGASEAAIPAVLKLLSERSYPAPPEPPQAFAITHASVIDAPVSDHAERVRAWAHCAFDGWSALAEPVAGILRTLGNARP